MLVSISTDIPLSQRERAVGLYDQAFERKFAPLIPETDKRRRLLLDCIDAERAFAALDETGELLGIVGFWAEGRSFTGGGGWSALYGHLGLWGSLRAAAGFALFERTPGDRELLLDGICVAANARGRGVGTKLLRALEAYARQQKFHSMRLDVIDTNAGARRLYEREGYVATATQKAEWLRPIFGFGAATTLVKNLVEPSLSHEGDLH